MTEYGQCGIGAYCLGGCDPRMSFSMDACVPAPVCESRTYPMDSLDRIVSIDNYLGDPSKADFVYQGEPLLYNDNVLLTMPAHSVGTVLASTTYMWYGTVRAKLKTSHGAGVVTAFILFSDVKDEIDYEWVGTDLHTAQTNYYFQGIPDYTQSGNITALTDTFSDFHDYEISWTPDEINWSVDGKVRRTKKRADTWNATANQWDYPQTPSRVQLSLWPGGADTNAQGTIDWAGGKVDWESDDIKEYGYYFATFGQVEVECWNATRAPGTNLHTSYTYNSWLATNDTVIDGDKPTVLKSFLGTGLDMNKGAPSGSQSGGSPTNSASGPIASVPGGTASGPGQAPQNSDGNTDGGSGTSGGGDGSQTGSSSGCVATGFSQDCSGNGNSGGGNGGQNAGARLEGMAGGSALAVVVALAGMLML
ncbi:concanavalin A-like lectin/glucanase domain-containing protein [Coniochaeta sp. 2T2.1]|nr:concanavalin A-like lectin/glucanase domain-containing protein [Coniochaeta sp. 2T2.1]